LLLGHGEAANLGFRVDRGADFPEQPRCLLVEFFPADAAQGVTGIEPQAGCW
jgi:hypothetical protein